MEFVEAFARLQNDTKSAEKFVKDPRGVLELMGVDTEGLTIQHTVEKPEALEDYQEGRLVAPEGGTGVTVCASVGLIVCATVGGDIGLKVARFDDASQQIAQR